MEQTPSLRDLVAILCKHQRQILALIVVTVGVAWVGVSLWPETYEASTQILIKLGREQTPLPSPMSDQGPLSVAKRPEDMNSEIQILKSRFLIEKVIRHLQDPLLTPPAEPPTFMVRLKAALQAAGRQIKDLVLDILVGLDMTKKLTPLQLEILSAQESLQVEPVRGSDVIEVRFQARDPQVAARVVNTLLDFYLEHHITVYKTPQARQFFERELAARREKLREYEQARAAFKQQWGLISLDEQKSLLLRQLAQIQTKAYEVQGDMAHDEAKGKVLARQAAVLSPSVRLSSETKPNPVVDSLKEKKLALELRRGELLTKYAAESRPLQHVEAEIAAVETRLAREEAMVSGAGVAGINPVHQRVEGLRLETQAGLAGLQTRHREHDRQLQGLAQRVADLDAKEMELKRLEREISLAEDVYRLYRKRAEEARISEAMDLERIANVTIISPALPPIKPVKPRKLLTLALAVVFSSLVGIGLAFVLEYFDRSIKTEDDVQRRLELPVLAVIPEVNGWSGATDGHGGLQLSPRPFQRDSLKSTNG